MPSRRTFGSCVAASCLGLLLAALGTPASVHAAASANSPPLVLTSFLPIHSVATAVAGDRLRIENWLPTGVDPHDFQFSPRDLRRLRQSAALLVAGMGLEGWTQAHLQSASGNPALRVIEVSTGFPAEVLIHEDGGVGHRHASGAVHHDDGGINPHFWLDPVLMMHVATNVARALTGIDPSGEAEFQRNAASLVQRLTLLHQDFDSALKSHRSTAFLTYHNAFPYLAARYGLRLVGVVESTAAEEPSARELSTLSQTVRRENARVLFVDSEPTRLARRLASDLKVRIVRLETLETGELVPGAYEAGMRRNLEALRSALSDAVSAPRP
ncbi:MAG: zinc ABC transporter substrate-binding protein [Verrucomicrobiales bacterium]|nr:zinc ABC transporter substrate-binding protein [Verrucomicrobiales bacterium]